jgi:iron complex outermembrane receptor protein
VAGRVVRGASSFGATYPKVYLDGIEVANPLLLNDLDPESIRRVEVIRGPQGAALYGSDAISGVVNIVTRQAPASGPLRLVVGGSAGRTGSQFASHDAASHEARVALSGGSNLASAGVGVVFRQSGDLFPGADSRQLNATAGARVVGSWGIFTATGRFFDKQAGAGANPLLSGLAADGATPTAASPPQQVREYTLGATTRFAGSGRWTHQVLVGVDGYRLSHLANDLAPIPWSLESNLGAANGSAARGSLRASSTARFGVQGEGASGTLTVGAEASILRQRSAVMEWASAGAGERFPSVVAGYLEEWRHSAGGLAQGSLAWNDLAFLSGGLRVERAGAGAGLPETSVLPMLGMALVRPLGPAEVKLRAAYGRGIRIARASAVQHLRAEDRALSTDLDPEEQAGVEFGAEVYLGQTLSLQATRFDQRATGLIQPVLVSIDSVYRDGVPLRHVGYQLQNVGEIANRGWELEGAYHHRGVSLGAALSWVDSRVRRVAYGYGGELRPGDRALAVPARTASLSAGWSGARGHAVLTLARAWDWINYDRLALARDFASADAAPVGARLRDTWRGYDGHTALGLTASRQVRRGVSVVLSSQNLLGGQLGEPDNVTIRSGRSLSLSLRAGL